MIRHVVCFRLKDVSQVPDWQRQSQMLRDINTVKNFSASPLLRQDRFHCALYMDFQDEGALAYYQAHPVHQQYLKEVLPPLAEEKLVVDLVD